MKADAYVKFAMLAGAMLLGSTCHLAAADEVPGTDDKTLPPVAVAIVEASVSKETGIQLRVELRNQSGQPCRISICPSAKLCCVADMFTVVEYDDSGKSLRDVGGTEKTAPCEVYLVKGAIYSFPMQIALNRLPEECRAKAGKPIDLKLGFIAGHNQTVYSDKVTLNLPE